MPHIFYGSKAKTKLDWGNMYRSLGFSRGLKSNKYFSWCRSINQSIKDHIDGILICLSFVALTISIIAYVPGLVDQIFNNTRNSVFANNFQDFNDLSIDRNHDFQNQREITSMVKYISSEIIEKNKIQITKPEDLAYHIVTESMIADEDPLFIAAVVLAESTFKTDARSRVGALGLMQVMPRTGKYIAQRINYDYKGKTSLTEPETNLRIGISYLKYLKKTFNNDLSKVLIAYNWGPTNVRDGKQAPKISINYSNRIQRNYKLWKKDYTKSYNKFRYAKIDSKLIS